jgi:glyoxylase-like metal-dependent hydrolase (beta-lactamase superfamily II)
MHTLAAGLSFVDLTFQNTPGVIATAVLQAAGGVALVDPGPSSSLPVLRRALDDAGIRVADLTALVLTHIHLDHAGAAGTLVRENPALQVFVHTNGARHLAAPEKLLASASRLYGDAMETLWGEVAPVPLHNIVALDGGEQIDAGGRRLWVAYTPGHASHHVSYFSADTGVAFVGDTAGVRLSPGGFIAPPTPPPDIDLEAWSASLARIGAWRPETLFLTHFGPASPPAPHLAELSDHLALAAALARTSLMREGSDEERAAWFGEEFRRILLQRGGADEARRYETAARFDLSWLGLARYWRKKGLAVTPSPAPA